MKSSLQFSLWSRVTGCCGPTKLMNSWNAGYWMSAWGTAAGVYQPVCATGRMLLNHSPPLSSRKPKRTWTGDDFIRSVFRYVSKRIDPHLRWRQRRLSEPPTCSKALECFWPVRTEKVWWWCGRLEAFCPSLFNIWTSILHILLLWESGRKCKARVHMTAGRTRGMTPTNSEEVDLSGWRAEKILGGEKRALILFY